MHVFIKKSYISIVSFIRWFWRIVAKLNVTQRQQLLYFATGSAALPTPGDISHDVSAAGPTGARNSLHHYWGVLTLFFFSDYYRRRARRNVVASHGVDLRSADDDTSLRDATNV